MMISSVRGPPEGESILTPCLTSLGQEQVPLVDLAQPLSVARSGSVKHQGRLAGTRFGERDALQGFASTSNSVG